MAYSSLALALRLLTICSTAVALPMSGALQVGHWLTCRGYKGQYYRDTATSGRSWQASQSRWPAWHCQILPIISWPGNS